MSALQRVGDQLGRAWDSLAEGWRELTSRCADALTRFTDDRDRGDRGTVPTTRWGLLAADVAATDDNVVVRLEAPGMDPDDFDIHVDGDWLVVAGQKRYERTEEGRGYVRTERAFGRFTRRIPLPAEVDADDVDARYRNGVLEIDLPRHERGKPRRIEIAAR